MAGSSSSAATVGEMLLSGFFELGVEFTTLEVGLILKNMQPVRKTSRLIVLVIMLENTLVRPQLTRNSKVRLEV